MENKKLMKLKLLNQALKAFPQSKKQKRPSLREGLECFLVPKAGLEPAQAYAH